MPKMRRQEEQNYNMIDNVISFENKALFLKDEEGYQLVWDDSLIFPNLASTDKVRVSTTQAERGEILDRNGRVSFRQEKTGGSNRTASSAKLDDSLFPLKQFQGEVG